MNSEKLRDAIIEKGAFRRNVYNMIPEGASRILDFGCGDGALLLRLQRDKACTELYGLEVNEAVTAPLKPMVDGVIHANIETDFSPLDKYKGFFKYIVLHDVIEHLFDPWLSLMKIRSLLAEDGQIIIATPNIHCWRLQHKIMSGLFPYGPGIWHTGHLRWYTPISFIELLVVGGLRIDALYLEIPYKVDLSFLTKGNEIKEVQFPPQGFTTDKEFPETYTVTYEKDISKYYPVFYAHKLIGVCGKGDLVTEEAPLFYDCPRLQQLRDALALPFDIHNPPPMQPLIGNAR